MIIWGVWHIGICVCVAFYRFSALKSSNSVNFEATKMVFTKKLVRISPQMDWYIYLWPQDGKMRYVTAVLVKTGEINFFLLIPFAGPQCSVVPIFWQWWFHVFLWSLFSRCSYHINLGLLIGLMLTVVFFSGGNYRCSFGARFDDFARICAS